MKKIFIHLILVFFLAKAQAQRNTILIIADDLSPDYFGFYENHVDTVDVPHIRSLLYRGVRFKNLMSNPVCSSTRTTILTGRYSFRTGVGGIVGGIGGSNQIDTSEKSITKLLKIFDSNIAKANIGKWHLSQATPSINLMNPLALGFDWYEGPFIGQLPNYFNWTKYTNGVASTVVNYASTENVNNAVSWLKNQATSDPFFLWIAFNAPHEPLHLPPAGLHTYTSLSGNQGNINNQPKEYFKAIIQAMDHEIGRLFDSLQVMNKFDSTDIIFIGDNGNTKTTAQIPEINQAKGTVYQYGVHVPMIFAGPSVVNPNRVSEALVNTVDLFATILENFGFMNWQAQIPVNKPVDSKSIMPIINNVIDSIRPWSFCELFKLTADSLDGKAIRNLDYKLIRFDYGGTAFYNLAQDSSENLNLVQNSSLMTSTDLMNYHLLCDSLYALTGLSGCPLLFTDELSADQEIWIYPNPSNTFINFDCTNGYAIFNVSGQIVQQSVQCSSNIDVRDLSKGIYLLKTENKVVRFIKSE